MCLPAHQPSDRSCSPTEVIFNHFISGRPSVEAKRQFQIAWVVSGEDRESVAVDEQVRVNTTTKTVARLVEPAVDIISNSARDVETFCRERTEYDAILHVITVIIYYKTSSCFSVCEHKGRVSHEKINVSFWF